MILEIPPELETRLRPLADQQGETLESFALSHLEKLASIDNGHGADGNGNGTPETREERRARINAAIDEAQAVFAPINRVFGDPVAALMADKRADVEREIECGL